MEVTINSSAFIAIIRPLHRSAISATRVGTLVTTKVPAAFSPTYVVSRVPSGTREMAVGGRKKWKITVLSTPVPHTLHTLLTSCPISLPYLILSHRTLQENQTALCVKVARAHSGTIVTKPASRPSPVIDDIPRIPRKVSSLAGGGRKLF